MERDRSCIDHHGEPAQLIDRGHSALRYLDLDLIVDPIFRVGPVVRGMKRVGGVGDDVFLDAAIVTPRAPARARSTSMEIAEYLYTWPYCRSLRNDKPPMDNPELFRVIVIGLEIRSVYCDLDRSRRTLAHHRVDESLLGSNEI